MYLCLFAVLCNLIPGIIPVETHFPKMEFPQLFHEFVGFLHSSELVASQPEWQRKVSYFLVLKKKAPNAI